MEDETGSTALAAATWTVELVEEGAELNVDEPAPTDEAPSDAEATPTEEAPSDAEATSTDEPSSDAEATPTDEPSSSEEPASTTDVDSGGLSGGLLTLAVPVALADEKLPGSGALDGYTWQTPTDFGTCPVVADALSPQPGEKGGSLYDEATASDRDGISRTGVRRRHRHGRRLRRLRLRLRTGLPSGTSRACRRTMTPWGQLWRPGRARTKRHPLSGSRVSPQPRGLPGRLARRAPPKTVRRRPQSWRFQRLGRYQLRIEMAEDRGDRPPESRWCRQTSPAQTLSELRVSNLRRRRPKQQADPTENEGPSRNREGPFRTRQPKVEKVNQPGRNKWVKMEQPVRPMKIVYTRTRCSVKTNHAL